MKIKKLFKKCLKNPLKKTYKKRLKKHIDKYSECKNIRLIEQSIFFDSSWYRNQYSDVRDKGI